MKVKNLTLASAGCLLMAGAANAAFVGVELHSMNHWFSTDHPNAAVKTSYNAGSFDSYRVYAVFDAPQGVLGASGDAVNPMYLTNVDNGTFFNYTGTTYHGGTQHFDVAPLPSGFAANPSSAYDTFATLGVPQGVDNTQFSPPGAGSDNGGVGNHFQNNWSSAEGLGSSYAWFQTAPFNAETNPQGLFSANSPAGAAPDGRFYVLLFQLTVDAGKKIDGRMGVALADGSIINDPVLNHFTTNSGTPAPGAIALLGLAGLAGGRRRRSA